MVSWKTFFVVELTNRSGSDEKTCIHLHQTAPKKLNLAFYCLLTQKCSHFLHWPEKTISCQNTGNLVLNCSYFDAKNASNLLSKCSHFHEVQNIHIFMPNCRYFDTEIKAFWKYKVLLMPKMQLFGYQNLGTLTKKCR
jgi:hypothetical protein